jgi:hypothetical protein
MSTFWGGSSRQGEDDRLEAKIDRLLSEQGIDPAQFDYQEEESPRLRPHNQTNAQRLTAQHPRPSGHA